MGETTLALVVDRTDDDVFVRRLIHSHEGGGGYLMPLLELGDRDTCVCCPSRTSF